MNLIIDIGNTLVKFAVFNGNTCVHKSKFELELFKLKLETVLSEFNKINKSIISSVGRLKEDDVVFLRSKLAVLELNSSTLVPFNNLYKTPTTLGVDRIALVSAAVFHYSNTNVLIIDAGSCITYDFLTVKNDYLGGAISPGVQMRYKALHDYTANLPFLKPKKPKSMVGISTKKSMHCGVIFGVIHEIDGVIHAYKQEYADLTVILTGGNAKFLSKQLKSSIFANSNFLLEGLNYILQFNSKE